MLPFIERVVFLLPALRFDYQPLLIRLEPLQIGADAGFVMPGSREAKHSAEVRHGLLELVR